MAVRQEHHSEIRALEGETRRLNASANASPPEVTVSLERQLCRELLAQLVSLTRSELGFMAELRARDNSAPTLALSAFTPSTREDAVAPPDVGFVLLDARSVFARAAYQREPVFARRPVASTGDHLPPAFRAPQHFLGLPLRLDGVSIGMVGLLDAPRGYTPELATQVAGLVSCLSLSLHAQRQHESMQREAARLRALLEQSEHVVIVIDRERRIRYASPAYTRLLGYERPVGGPLPRLHPDDAPLLEDLLARALAHPGDVSGGGVGGRTLRVTTAAGGFAELEGHAINLLDDPAVRGIVLHGHDARPRRSAEQANAKLQTQAQHAQKLESLGVLAGGIAHDFNNLLVAILGNISLARLDLPAGHAAHAALIESELASQRAADLCRQMLEYSGRGRLAVQPIDLSALIEDMEPLLVISAGAQVRVRLRLDPALPLVAAESTQLQQVIVNLVANAVEAIGERTGDVTIVTGTRECDREYLRESYLDEQLQPGSYVYVEVSDNGCGMDSQTLERVFEPFFTTKFTGRGLGLASVLGIIRGHSGAIKVQSEPQRGTTFRVLLPVAADAAAREQREVTDAYDYESSVHAASGTILVVDDEATVRLVTQRMLEMSGYRVLAAADGLAALELYRQHMHAIDVVLLDMTMPHMDGAETFRLLRDIDAGVRVVLTSGYSEQATTSRFAGMDLCGFLQKPYGPQELIALLRRAQALQS